MIGLYALARPFLMNLEPERGHALAIKILSHGWLPRAKADAYPNLHQRIWSRDFVNPLGLAAGFDKNAEAVRGIERLGFGFIEVGTVTPRPQFGNPQPRIFRDEDNKAIINRMGFPNEGADIIKERVHALRRAGKVRVPLGINIGKNKSTLDPFKDYEELIRHFYDDADYLVINISSPNTPGLRQLQEADPLKELLDRCLEARAVAANKSSRFDMPPLLVKVSPDLHDKDVEEIGTICLKANIDGLIVSNTSLARPTHLSAVFKDQDGGLSGAPINTMSTELIKKFYRVTKGRLTIIGVGGVSTGHDAYQKIRAGASLLQLYTALVFQGPVAVTRILNQLSLLVQKDGFKNIQEMIGIDADSV